MRNLLLAPDSHSLHKKAAEIFTDSVREAVLARGRAAVAFSGGSTPQGFFRALSDPQISNQISWSRLHIFFVDERCVPPSHPESNFGLAERLFLSKVPIPKDNIHRMAGEMASPPQAAKDYEDHLKAHFMLTEEPPHFDFMQLGLGVDGHIASLFPRSDALREHDHWITANYVESISGFRLTMTFPLINNARRILLLVTGQTKAEILKEVLLKEDKGGHYPAQMVQPKTGEIIWLFDREAASQLPPDLRYQAFHL